MKSVCHEKSSLSVSWNPPSVTRSVCHQNIMIQTVILNPDDRWQMTDDNDKAGQVQSELSAGEREMLRTPQNVPARTVSRPDDPV